MECPNGIHHMLPYHRWQVVPRKLVDRDYRDTAIVRATFAESQDAMNFAAGLGDEWIVREAPIR